MSEMEAAKANAAVQNILSGAIEATASLALADSQRRYGGSCHSLTSEAASSSAGEGGGGRRSRIPLPRSAAAAGGREESSPLPPPSLSGRSTPAMRRENSLAQIHFVSKKKVRQTARDKKKQDFEIKPF